MKQKYQLHTRLQQLRLWLVAGVVSFVALAPVWSPSHASAASFSMRTGYYLGTGAANSISGLGFQPQLVIIRASTTAGVGVIKTSAMAANATAFFSATADNTATSITLDADGFSVGTLANVNTVNVLYRWMAFDGSDCTSTGYFCVGTYTGNGAASRTITTGFQPDMVLAKRSTAVAAHFRTASMAANRTEYFTSTAANTAGAFIANSVATGFTVGTSDNTTGGIYYYIVFRAASGAFAEGSYTGNGTAGTNITGLGFQPDALIIKNSTSATANNRRSIFYSDKHFGDLSSYISDAVADATGMVQAITSDGFTLGAGVNTNQSGATAYWFAFGGAPPMSGSGSFSMAQGTYTGTGASNSISGLGFQPSLVIVKNNAAQQGVFRTDQMIGDATGYLASATADFTGGITSLDSDGFTVGTSATTNTSGNTYQWQAFGGAYNPGTQTGAADFATGVYYGNGLTGRPITDMPFQPDLVVVKRAGATAGAFRTSAYTGDLSDFFAATAETTGVVQSLDSNGFTVGTNAATNTSGQLYRWFAFKAGTNFDVGTYTGNGTTGLQVGAPFWSDAIWIKRSTAVAGVQRPSTLAGNTAQYFANTANAANLVTEINASGFTVGNNTSTNASGGVYRYAVWRVPPTGTLGADIVDGSGTSVGSPSITMSVLSTVFNCTQSTGTLGTPAEHIRVSNMSANAGWNLSLAPTDGPTALWRNVGNIAQYDFNDPTGSTPGCQDGSDVDSVAGLLSVQMAAATLTPQSGCSTTNINFGADNTFDEGTTDSVPLLTAAAGSNTECYWDLAGITLKQQIPAEQAPGTYSINFTITATSY